MTEQSPHNPVRRDLDVVVIGNAGVDTNVYLCGADVDWSVEANFTENIDYVGQAGAYASRGYSALGLRTAFIGAVGDDTSGRWVRATLEADGIDTSAMWTDPAGTARSINVMYRDGRRKNFYDGKGHMALAPDMDRCEAVLSRCRLAHFNIPNWARQLLLPAKRHGVVVACDLQDVVDPRDPYRSDFVAAADFLFFSAANYADPSPLIEDFLARGPAYVIVAGMGARGCAVGTREGIRYFGAVEGPEPVVDTNGAGDALAAGFLSSYVLHAYSLEDSVLRGQIAARYVCGVRASTGALISADELDRRHDAARF